MMDAVLVKNADRMMMTASLLENGIEMSFADGSRGLIPFSDIPEINNRAALSGLELPNPYEMVLRTELRRAGGDSLGLRPTLL